ncbi:tetratricopeptide repeat protein [Mucilaginibacter sp. S1162]|uniref:Tetratricopeptide repeat protein n=1 Tax=Mucilaginibacter humi TaxID=2732510 RepID=A0ABX1W0U2_9SPHI|nr:tetratricopeptide repeat protein [Mucilaginibacter humi]
MAKNQHKDYKGAIADLKKALAINPNDAVAYVNLGNSYIFSANYGTAIQYYNEAIKLNPDYANAYNTRGIAKYFYGDKKGACVDINKAASLGFSGAKASLARYCR